MEVTQHCLWFLLPSKNPTNALYCVYVNAILFILNHSYMLQPSRGNPQGLLIYFVSRVNRMRVQM